MSGSMALSSVVEFFNLQFNTKTYMLQGLENQEAGISQALSHQFWIEVEF